MKLINENTLDLSIVMPCLNEEKTVGSCVNEAKRFISAHGLNAEILVTDNGSTDGSAEAARKNGALVISEPRRGYGRALRTGFENSRGNVIIFADCDTTYDFLHLEPFYFPLAHGEYDLITGDRFSGGMEKGAMPFTHRLGVPFLSWCGRKRFKVAVRDFHCGLRGMTRAACEKLELSTDGMEFATEMIAEAARREFHIGQTPVTLRRAKYEHSSKLHTFSDGIRHLRYILSYKKEG